MIEKLEQLRALEMGYRIAVEIVEFDTIGIDVPSDLKKLHFEGPNSVNLKTSRTIRRYVLREVFFITFLCTLALSTLLLYANLTKHDRSPPSGTFLISFCIYRIIILIVAIRFIYGITIWF